MENLMGAPPDIIFPRLEPLRYTCLNVLDQLCIVDTEVLRRGKTYGVNGGP